MSDPSIPGVKFDPRIVGPIDLLAAAWRRVTSFISENSTALIAAVVAIVVAQAGIYAWKGIVFLAPPRVPNWVLVAFFGSLAFMPLGLLLGVLLARGLYDADTQLVSIMSAQSGEQRLVHLGKDLFDSLTIVNQNGDEKDLSYLIRTRINGSTAIEVDSFDRERGVLVASSMAGRSNQDIRHDRLQIRKIKTTMEAEVDEATEIKANARDIIRERAASVANWIIRTSQGATIPDGAHLHDEMQKALESVDPLAEMDESPAGSDDDEDGKDAPRGPSVDKSEVMDIFARAEALGATDGSGAPADD